jgi:2-polyprenyl-3-methyl-5-hydroxy-6-metoxy-1,4-benzoquinol methylase
MLGLVEEGAVQRLTSTDVSLKFLRSLAAQVARYSTPVSLIACDANESHFRSGVFDLVVGRSVLHHLLDYEQTLAQCRAALQSGGMAVFYEPVLEGKTITTLFMALMLRCDETADVGQFSEPERAKIRGLISHQMKSILLPQNRALETREQVHLRDCENDTSWAGCGLH